MNRIEALIALNMFMNIGSFRLGKLLEYFGTPENIFKAGFRELTAVFGIGNETATKICSFKRASLDKELALIKKHGLQVLTTQDDSYPQNLKNIPGAPIVLYVKGKITSEDNNSIAIVGSRRATLYGLSCAEKFSAQLSERGITIVSGMARGIDTSAHKGALKSSGRTLAVIGSGHGRIYPPENIKLADEIAGRGAVISEFPVNAEPMKENFPRRNRVISGLSLGVVVVEAAQNSGALITADFALEQGREVFAMPGKIDSENSFGVNNLIKQGAKLVTNVEDIIEEFEPVPDAVKPIIRKEAIPGNINLDSEEALLFSFINKDQPVYIDDILKNSCMDIPRLSTAALKLERKRLIRQLPGKQFIKL